MTILRSGSATDVGRVRAVNEDLALESLTLYAVADGMGGHAGGEIASRVAIDALKAGFGRQPTVNGLVDAIEGANDAVWERGRNDPALRGMGTTMTAAALVGTGAGDRLVLANVGDSRTYRFRDGALEQVSTDHSVAEELVARGELSEEEAQFHPHRHILTRALGVSPDVDVDIWEVEPRAGDRYLLCSDGLSNEVSHERIEALLSSTPDPGDAAAALVREANEAGGNDNITAVVLDVVVADEVDAAVAGDAISEAVAAPVASDDASASPGPILSAPAVAAVPSGGAPVVTADGAIPAVRVASSTTTVPHDAHARQLRVRGPRRITFRVLFFFVLLGAIAYGAWALIRWYVDGSYYVGLDKSQVVIFEGRPGGFVGMEPKIIERSSITTTEINSDVAASLRTGVQEPSRKAAENYVGVLMCTTSPTSETDCSSPTSPTTTVAPTPATTTTPTTVASASAARGRRGGAAPNLLAVAVAEHGAPTVGSATARAPHTAPSRRCSYCQASNTDARALARPFARRRLWPA